VSETWLDRGARIGLNSVMSVTAIAKGLATFVVPMSWVNRSPGRTLSARYCYSVFLRHLVWLREAGADTDPRVVAEIGPGASIGTGLAALIAGAEHYYGFDVKQYGLNHANVAIFDELVALFEVRAAVPGLDEFPAIKPALQDEGFPHHVLDDRRLARALDKTRLRSLRAALASDKGANGTEPVVSYVAPWFAPAERRPASVDWIFSQAVMEHVDDLDETYRACFDWLSPGKAMSHQIDFKSHGTATHWNGHWAYSDLTWRLVRGGRLYLINRAPHSAHLAAITAAGFEVLSDLRVSREDGLARERLAGRFRRLPAEDVVTAGAFVIARKPAA
jgi:SAM-dependent methyltransferase